MEILPQGYKPINRNLVATGDHPVSMRPMSQIGDNVAYVKRATCLAECLKFETDLSNRLRVSNKQNLGYNS